MNEPAFLYQLFAREYGTNNLPDCSNMCHRSDRGQDGLVDRRRQVDGQLFGPRKADLIMVIGANRAPTIRGYSNALEGAKRKRAGSGSIRCRRPPCLVPESAKPRGLIGRAP